MNEEMKFISQLLSPNLHELEEQFKTFGLKYDDFVTILHRRMKGRLSRTQLHIALDSLHDLQQQIKTATIIKEDQE